MEQRPALVGGREPAIVFHVEAEESRRHELADQRAPFLLLVFGAGSEDGQAVMAGLGDLLCQRPPQHIDDVDGAEALPGPINRRDGLLPLRRAVHHVGGVEADVAVPARLDPFAEIGEQDAPPAGGGLAIAKQRVEAPMLAPLALLAGLFLLDEHSAHADVAQPVQHVCLGRSVVASGAADLLVIRL